MRRLGRRMKALRLAAGMGSGGVYDAYIQTAGNDATAQLRNPTLPFATINAALDALPASGGSIKIGLGTFAPVACDNSGGWPIPAAASKIKDNVHFIGSGRPNIKADKTGLEGGTIIKGPLGLDHNGLWLIDLGVDSGSAVCSADYGGVAKEGLVMANMGHVPVASKPARTGIVLRNVSSICKNAASLVHCVLLENMDGALIEDVYTCFGFAGVVLKISNSIARRLTMMGHDAGALYIKTNTYALGYDTAVSDVTISCVNAGDTEAIQFANEDGSSPELYGFTVDEVVANATKHGVLFDTNSGNTTRNCAVTNLTGTTTVAKTGAGTVTDCTVNGTPV